MFALTDDPFHWLCVAGLFGQAIIRGPHARLRKSNIYTRDLYGAFEQFLIFLVFVGMFLIPVVTLFVRAADPFGDIPPAEAEAAYWKALEPAAIAASLWKTSLRDFRCGSDRAMRLQLPISRSTRLTASKSSKVPMACLQAAEPLPRLAGRSISSRAARSTALTCSLMSAPPMPRSIFTLLMWTAAPVSDAAMRSACASMPASSAEQLPRNRRSANSPIWMSFSIWRASEDLTCTFGAHAIDTTFKRYLNSLTLAPGVPVVRVPDPRDTITQPWSYLTENLRFVTAEADWTIGEGWSLELGGLIGENDRPFLSVAPTLIAANGDKRSSRTSVDSTRPYHGLRATLRGAFDTGPIAHDFALSVSQDFFGLDTFNITFPQFLSNIYDRVIIPRPTVTPGPRGRSLEQESTSIGATHIAEFGPVSTILGLRSIRIEQRNFNPVTGVLTRDYDEAAIVPTFAVQYELAEDWRFYANYSQGLEPGGTAPATAVNANELQPPIESEQIEAGFKWQASPRLLVTGAVFEIERGLEFLDAGANRYVQDGAQVHRGGELIITGALTDALTISGGYTYLDPTAERTASPATDGNRPIGVSQNNFSLFGEYRLPFNGDIRLNATLEHRSSQFVGLANTREIDAWTVFGLGARTTFAAGGLPIRLTLRIDNVFDEAFWQSASGGSLAIGGPRTISFAVGTSF